MYFTPSCEVLKALLERGNKRYFNSKILNTDTVDIVQHLSDRNSSDSGPKARLADTMILLVSVACESGCVSDCCYSKQRVSNSRVISEKYSYHSLLN